MDKKPIDEVELSKVKGFGAKKIEKYYNLIILSFV